LTIPVFIHTKSKNGQLSVSCSGNIKFSGLRIQRKIAVGKRIGCAEWRQIIYRLNIVDNRLKRVNQTINERISICINGRVVVGHR
jgi:hypothetical protein